MAKKSTAPVGLAEKSDKQHFFRILELDLKEGDTFRGYQVERVEVVDGQVVNRSLIDKPNLFEYAQSAMMDLLDPRNNVEAAPASEFV